jgi:hypothetical protein
MANPDLITLLQTLKPDPVSLAILETIDVDRCMDYDPADDDAKMVRTASAELEKLFKQFMAENKNKSIHRIFWDYSTRASDLTAFTATASYRRGFQDAILLLQAHKRNNEK